VREILQQRPVESSSVTGTFSVRSKRERAEVPVRFEVIVGPTNWQSVYEVIGFTNGAPPQKLVITRDGTSANRYELNGDVIPPGETAVPFAGTDFWLMDLGFEFFHWPQQRVVKKEFRSNCACTVIESTNPSRSPGGYSRVTTWIDQESLGIVHAEARDVSGKLLKVFDPKALKKIRGQYEVEEIQIKNLQTGSRTRLEFDLE
jgi:hypothetical protein